MYLYALNILTKKKVQRSDKYRKQQNCDEKRQHNNLRASMGK